MQDMNLLMKYMRHSNASILEADKKGAKTFVLEIEGADNSQPLRWTLQTWFRSMGFVCDMIDPIDAETIKIEGHRKGVTYLNVMWTKLPQLADTKQVKPDLLFKYTRRAYGGLSNGNQVFRLAIDEADDCFALGWSLGDKLTTDGFNPILVVDDVKGKTSLDVSWSAQDNLLVEREAMEVVLKYYRRATTTLAAWRLEKEWPVPFPLEIELQDTKWSALLCDVLQTVGYGCTIVTKTRLALVPTNDIRVIEQSKEERDVSDQVFRRYIQAVNAALIQVREDPDKAKYFAFDIERAGEWKDVLLGVFTNKGYDCFVVSTMYKAHQMRIILTWDKKEEEKKTGLYDEVSLPSSEKMKSGLIRRYLNDFAKALETHPYQRTVSIDLEQHDEDLIPQLRLVLVAKGYRAVSVSFHNELKHRLTIAW